MWNYGTLACISICLMEIKNIYFRFYKWQQDTGTSTSEIFLPHHELFSNNHFCISKIYWCLLGTAFLAFQTHSTTSWSFNHALMIHVSSENHLHHNQRYIECSLQFCVKLVSIVGRKMQIHKIWLINLMVILVIFLPLFVQKYM